MQHAWKIVCWYDKRVPPLGLWCVCQPTSVHWDSPLFVQRWLWLAALQQTSSLPAAPTKPYWGPAKTWNKEMPAVINMVRTVVRPHFRVNAPLSISAWTTSSLPHTHSCCKLESFCSACGETNTRTWLQFCQIKKCIIKNTLINPGTDIQVNLSYLLCS